MRRSRVFNKNAVISSGIERIPPFVPYGTEAAKYPVKSTCPPGKPATGLLPQTSAKMAMLLQDEEWCDSELLSSDACLDLLDGDPTFLHQLDPTLLAEQSSSCFGFAGEEPTGRSNASRLCWGGLISGLPEGCTPGFVPQSNHFKNKLCPQCKRNGIMVPTDRIKPLTEPAMKNAAAKSNAHSSGLWSRTGDGQEARIVNHTAKCSGPQLLIYRHPRPPEERAVWPPMPDGWVEPGARSMRLALALGTLRPTAAMNRARSALNGATSSAAGMAARPESAAPQLATASTADGVPTSSVPTSRRLAGDGQGTGGIAATAPTHAIEPPSKRLRLPLAAGGDALHAGSDGTLEAAAALGIPTKEDLAAVAAAVNDEGFQRDFDERLQVCAAGFASLGAHGRALSHRMFCDSTRHALATAAGEQPVARVLGAVMLDLRRGGWGGGGWGGWDGGDGRGGNGFGGGDVANKDEGAIVAMAGPELSYSCLFHCVACLCDVRAWEHAAESAAGSHTAAGSHSASGSRTDGDCAVSPASLADSFKCMGIHDAAASATAQLDDEWRARVRRMLPLLESVKLLPWRGGPVQSPGPVDWLENGCGVTEGSEAGSCLWHGIYNLALGEALPEAECSAGAGPPHGFVAEAREILRVALAQEGFSPGHAFSTTDRVWHYAPVAETNFVERMFEQMLGNLKQYRGIEEEVEDGVRLVIFGYEDCAMNDALCVVSIVFDRALRRWRFYGGDFRGLPKGIWTSGAASLVATPFLRLAEMCYQFGWERFEASMSKLVDERRRSWQSALPLPRVLPAQQQAAVAPVGSVGFGELDC